MKRDLQKRPISIKEYLRIWKETNTKNPANTNCVKTNIYGKRCTKETYTHQRSTILESIRVYELMILISRTLIYKFVNLWFSREAGGFQAWFSGGPRDVTIGMCVSSKWSRTYNLNITNSQENTEEGQWGMSLRRIRAMWPCECVSHSIVHELMISISRTLRRRRRRGERAWVCEGFARFGHADVCHVYALSRPQITLAG